MDQKDVDKLQTAYTRLMALYDKIVEEKGIEEVCKTYMLVDIIEIGVVRRKLAWELMEQRHEAQRQQRLVDQEAVR